MLHNNKIVTGLCLHGTWKIFKANYNRGFLNAIELKTMILEFLVCTFVYTNLSNDLTDLNAVFTNALRY